MKTTTITDEEVYDMYKHLLNQKDSGLIQEDYCKKHKVNFKRFQNMRSVIFFPKTKKNQDYSKYFDAARKCIDEDLNVKNYCMKVNLAYDKVLTYLRHVKFLYAINRELEKEGKQPMQFIEVKKSMDRDKHDEVMIPEKNSSQRVHIHELIIDAPMKTQITEVIEAKNDIELLVAKGVRVIISPQFESSKIIKIIDLLKDL